MSSGNDIKEPDDILAAEYVLGVLPHAERVAFAARLEADPALQERVRFWESHMVAMADDVAPVSPPENILADIEARIFADGAAPAPASPAAASAGWWSSLGFWRSLSFISLAAVIILAGLYAGIFKGPSGGGTAAPVYVAELTGKTDDVRLVTLYDAKSGVLKVNRVKGAPAAGRSFELWLIEGGNAPVSLGVVPEAERGDVRVPEALRGKFAGAVLAISDEPFGGSPTGKATGPVIAVGKVSAI